MSEQHSFVMAEDGTRLFTRVLSPSGASIPNRDIALLDGIGCDGWAWKYLAQHFAETHRVVHSHYRGHGRSGAPRDQARIDVPALARDVIAVLDACSVERAVLIGHSMGTQVALETYRLAPSRVSALVLVCGSYGKVTSTFHGSDMLKQVLPRVIEVVQKRRGLARAIWGRVPPRLAFRIATLSRDIDGLALREEDFHQYIEHVASMDPDVFLAMLKLAGEHTAEDILARVDVPTLVIAAEKDTFTPAELAAHMAEAIPGAEHFVLRGGTHAAPVEQPIAMALRIDKFLREHVYATEQPHKETRN